MKWDYSTNPPKAWRVEDGDYVPVNPLEIEKCLVCQKWFITDPISVRKTCSPGCSLKLAEKSSVEF